MEKYVVKGVKKGEGGEGWNKIKGGSNKDRMRETRENE